jgi:hypothetical protein
MERITAAEYLAQNERVGRRPKRAHKYGAKAKVVDGHSFPSTAEANRYSKLKLLERAGTITDLVLQPRYPLVSPRGDGEGTEPVGEYVADFAYNEWKFVPFTVHHSVKVPVVEDVKGVATAVYRLKLRLFKAQYPHLTFREIKAPRRRRRRAKRGKR